MWTDVLIFVGVGFAAQLVDGALGMAYGVTATSVLLSFGVTPAVASASVHAAEVFTTAASGAAHWRLGNIDWRLVVRLAIPGMIGGAFGAYVLTEIPAGIVRPLVGIYLLVMGLLILRKALHRRPPAEVPLRYIPTLGFTGGFLDAVGGGGWGAIVTSTLLGKGTKPRFAIGSVSLSEFFVTASISAAFVATIGLELWPIITGLIIGGVIAAPLGALMARHLPDRWLMLGVAILIILLSLRVLIRTLTAWMG
jgi:uncharacterized membrane protein YfcA